MKTASIYTVLLKQAINELTEIINFNFELKLELKWKCEFDIDVKI